MCKHLESFVCDWVWRKWDKVWEATQQTRKCMSKFTPIGELQAKLGDCSKVATVEDNIFVLKGLYAAHK